MINPHSRCSLSPRHGNDPPATTAVVVATVGGYSSCLLRMTADEGSVGDDTCLTSGRMCTCVLSTSSASIDLYFYLPFLVAATHFDIFLKHLFKIWYLFSLPLKFIYITLVFIILISSLSSSNLSIFHVIIYSFMPSLSQLRPASLCSLAPSAPPSRLRAALVPPTSASFGRVLKYWWLLPSERSAGGPRLHREKDCEL